MENSTFSGKCYKSGDQDFLCHWFLAELLPWMYFMYEVSSQIYGNHSIPHSSYQTMIQGFIILNKHAEFLKMEY